MSRIRVPLLIFCTEATLLRYNLKQASQSGSPSGLPFEPTSKPPGKRLQPQASDDSVNWFIRRCPDFRQHTSPKLYHLALILYQCGVSVCCKFTKSSMGIKRGKDRQGGRDEIRQHKMIWYSISLHTSLKENISTQMPFQMTDYVFKHLSVFNIIQNQNLFPKNVWAESGEILEHSSEMSQSMSTWQLEQKMYLFKPIILLWKKQSKTTTPHTQTYTHLFFLPKVFIPCKFLQRKHFRFCYLRWEVPPQGLDMIQDKKAVFNIAQILKLCYQTHTFVFESTNNLVSFICRLRHTGSSHMAMMTPLEWLCPLQYQRSPWLWRHFKACWINIPEGLVGWWRPSEKVFEVGINMASLESKTGYHSHYDVGTRGLHHETSESKIHTTFFSFC